MIDGIQVSFTDTAIVSTVNEVKVATTAKFILNEKTQLVQQNPGSVNSPITFIRNTNFIKRFDFTYFSSPVDGQALNTIGYDGPNNNFLYYNNDFNGGIYAPPLFDKYFYWDAFATPDPGYVASVNTGKWTNVLETSTMLTGRGYIIRAPQSFPASPSQKWTVAFTGEPHNASEYSYPISGSTYTSCASPTNKSNPNLVGNPYPCSLDLDTFLTHPFNINKINGSVYFWTHKVPIAPAGNGTYQYLGDDYILYNVMGGLGYKLSGTQDPAFPNMSNRNSGKVASCQSFFVNGVVPGGGFIKFTADMRGSNNDEIAPTANDGQFYKASGTNPIPPAPPIRVSISKSRIWLSVEQGASGQGSNYKETLIGYTNGQANSDNGVIPPATNDFEKLYDAESVSTDQNLKFYSVLNSITPCPKLAIQGRALGTTFNVNDVVNLGITCPAGTYRIKAELWDGIFSNGQGFLLKVNNNDGTSSLYDIKNAPYVLTTSVALTDNITKFQLVFLPAKLMQITNQCGTTVPSFGTQIFSYFIGGTPTGVTITYVYKITNSAGNSFNAYHSLDDQTLSNIFYGLNPSPLFFNSTYTIQVAAIINGVQQPFSSEACSITTPIPPPTSLQSICGTSLPSFGSLIYANAAQSSIGAKGYKWRVQRMDTFQIGSIQTVLRNLNLNLITNILPSTSPNFVQANKQYCVEVAIVYNGDIISAYSPVCCFNTGLSKMNLTINNTSENNTFAIAYPNPFSNNFNLKLETINNEAVEVKVYDMFGKLVTSYNVIDSDIEKLEIGNNYKTGIYNIVISSSDNVYTQRIIKR